MDVRSYQPVFPIGMIDCYGHSGIAENLQFLLLRSTLSQSVTFSLSTLTAVGRHIFIAKTCFCVNTIKFPFLKKSVPNNKVGSELSNALNEFSFCFTRAKNELMGDFQSNAICQHRPNRVLRRLSVSKSISRWIVPGRTLYIVFCRLGLSSYFLRLSSVTIRKVIPDNELLESH